MHLPLYCLSKNNQFNIPALLHYTLGRSDTAELNMTCGFSCVLLFWQLWQQSLLPTLCLHVYISTVSSFHHWSLVCVLNVSTIERPELSLQLLHLVPTQILTCTVVNPATGWSASIQKTLQVTGINDQFKFLSSRSSTSSLNQICFQMFQPGLRTYRSAVQPIWL